MATRPFYHLDEVVEAAGADVGDAGAVVDLRDNLPEYVLDVAVGVKGAARHEGGAVANALLTPMSSNRETRELPRTTWWRRLMKRAREESSTTMRKTMSGETAMREMLEEAL
ncbi:hypothetical protein MRB53_011136 [Persea americana]|uniref:Uncharacterized protein n=1 Tax=Persea americana TaxID=3435 RepID=A0ACC2LV29_PERAE|nr:hypothetical protein MRB53_011136 [Persea americana]